MKLLFLLISFAFSVISSFGQNVGVGTTTPVSKLHVNDSVAVNTVISLTNTNGGVTNQASIALKNFSSIDKALQFFNICPGAFTTTRLYNFLDVNTNSIMSILNNGNVGIGTANPKNRMDISGAMAIGGGYSGISTAPANGLLVEGQLGLGVTTPLNKLDINGSTVIGGSYSGMVSAPVNSLLVENRIGIGVTSPMNKLDINGSTVIDSSYSGIVAAPANSLLIEGRLGVGVITPQNKIDINGNMVIGSGYSGTITAPANSLLVQGNIGIGVASPLNKLDVEGGAVIGASYSGTNLAPSNGLLIEGLTGLGTTDPKNRLDIEGSTVIGQSYSGTITAPANSLVVENRIGVGVTTPQNRLDVNGSMVVGGFAGTTLAPVNGLPNSSKIDQVIEMNKEAVVQDRSSQRVGEFLSMGEPGKSDRVWDCCAASGGKSILLHDLFPDLEIIVSDVRESILINLKKRFREAGIKNYKSFVADLSATGLPVENNGFKLIIADVPCTGSGTWGRNPENLSYFERKKIDEYVSLQKKITSNVIPHLKPGGFFLYITCSVFRKENEDVVSSITQNFPLQLKRMEVLKGYDKKADTMFAALLQNTL